MNDPKIVLLAGKGISTNILYHALRHNLHFTAIIVEEPVSKKAFLKKRIKKLGLLKVIGQIFFQLLIVPFLDRFAAGRKKEIKQLYGLNDAPLPFNDTIMVNSVNDEACIKKLQALAPNLVIVNGTRIISANVLNAVAAVFINMHAGITPKYRGVHGAYWALVNNDPENCGVTIHRVDKGIDTGGVIDQKKIEITPKDSFVTYPLLQLATGIPLMQKAITNFKNDAMGTVAVPGPSKLWFHPTMGQYLYNRIAKRIR